MSKADEIYKEMKARAEELKDEVCTSFPHLVCNEVPGLHFDNWCEPCQAKIVMKAMASHEKKLNSK